MVICPWGIHLQGGTASTRYGREDTSSRPLAGKPLWELLPDRHPGGRLSDLPALRAEARAFYFSKEYVGMLNRPLCFAGFMSLLAHTLLPFPLEGQEVSWRLTPEAEGWAIQSFTTEEGLPQNSVNDLLISRDGYLWLGTFGGLSRFDGVRFVNFDQGNAPSLPGLRVLSLFESAQGELWIGFQEGGVAVRRNGAFQAVLPAGSAGVVWDLEGDGQGQIWVASSDGVGILQEGGDIRWVDGWEQGRGANGLLVSGDTVWVLGEEARELAALTLSGEALASLRLEGRLGSLRGPHPGPDGSILLGTGLGLVEGSPSGIQGIPVPGEAGPWGDADDAWRWALAGRLQRSGRQESPLPSTGLSLPLFEPLPAAVRTGLVDREGGVWLGTNGRGLLRLSRPLLHTVPGIDNPQALTEDPAGNVWAAACGPEIPFITPGLVVRSVQDEGPGFRCFRSIGIGPSERVWLGGTQDGMRRAREEGVEIMGSPPGAPGGEHFTGRGSSFRVWNEGRTFDWAEGKWRRVRAFPAMERAEVSSLLDMGDSGFLLGTMGGHLFHGSATDLVHLSPEDVDAPFAIRGMVQDPDGGVWIGTYGRGLKYWPGDGEIRTLGTGDGLAENVAIGLLIDDDGNLWMTGNHQLSRISLAQLKEYLEGGVPRLKPITYGFSDGFMEGNGVTAVKTADGRLWFPGIDGVMVVDPEELERFGVSGKVLVEAITADGEPVPHRDAVLSSATREVQVDYTLPAFARPENIRFRYRLHGLNDEWTDPGFRRSAFFSNLPPGDYVFEVEAEILETGERSLASLPIRVTPTLIQSFWFRALIMGLLLGGLLLLMHSRVQALTRRTLESERHARELRREMEERMRLQDEKDALSAQLLHAQKMEAVGRLTGGIAHDFNNLLTTIMGHLDLLEEKLGDSVNHHVSAAMGAATRAGSLTRELLAFSRRSPLEPVDAELAPLLERMNPLIRTALKSNIHLKVLSDPDLWDCRVDPTRVENVILNLCINARDAMPEGGTLLLNLRNVRLEGEEASRRDVSQGEYVCLEVSDTGEGIPAELLDQVMDPFFTTKEMGKGTGLGLSMAFGFAKQSGGHLELESREGGGTTVRLFLPRGTGVIESGSAPSTGIPMGKGEKILVVEDDEALRAITMEYLRLLRYRPIPAASAEAARGLLAEEPDFSLVLTDVLLPGESGFALAQDLFRWRPELPVILVSGTREGLPDSQEDLQVEEGVWGWFLSKPFTRRMLGEAVHEALREVREKG